MFGFCLRGQQNHWHAADQNCSRRVPVGAKSEGGAEGFERVGLFSEPVTSPVFHMAQYFYPRFRVWISIHHVWPSLWKALFPGSMVLWSKIEWTLRLGISTCVWVYHTALYPEGIWRDSPQIYNGVHTLCVCVREHRAIYSVPRVPQRNRKPVWDPSLFLRSLGKETLGGGFYRSKCLSVAASDSFCLSLSLFPGVRDGREGSCGHCCASGRVPVGAWGLLSLHILFFPFCLCGWLGWCEEDFLRAGSLSL